MRLRKYERHSRFCFASGSSPPTLPLRVNPFSDRISPVSENFTTETSGSPKLLQLSIGPNEHIDLDSAMQIERVLIIPPNARHCRDLLHASECLSLTN
jgi:hypothetical protein